MILAIELMKDPATRTPWPWEERRGLRIYRHALERGALIRPLGTTIYFMPPYVIAPDGDRPAGAHRHRRHRARMRLTRVFVEQTLVSGKGVGLPEQAGLHLTRVLRLERRRAAHAVRRHRRRVRGHARARRQEVWARVGAHDPPSSANRRCDITLIQGVARGERMDLIVQKATELGVTRIVPVFAERSVVKVDAKQRARKLEHWQADRDLRLRTMRAQSRARSDASRPRWATPSRARTRHRALSAGRRCARFAGRGSAAGRRPARRAADRARGRARGQRARFRGREWLHGLRMGPRILRTETAGLAALAVLQTRGGDFAR